MTQEENLARLKEEVAELQTENEELEAHLESQHIELNHKLLNNSFDINGEQILVMKADSKNDSVLFTIVSTGQHRLVDVQTFIDLITNKEEN